YKAVAEHAMSEFPSLNRFNSDLFEHKVSEFQQISHEFERQSQEELFARLASRVPNFTQEAHRNSEVGILLRAIRSRGRGLSIRNLFDSISTLLPRLTPCMLMSPLSVAQYFDPQKTSFDMVIFDEASQMPTFEEVGAIARGKSLI